MRSIVVASLALLLFVAACQPIGQGGGDLSGRTIKVVTTTSMIADLVREVGGDRVEVTGLMGPGVDPHLYKASEGDVARMAGADIIFFNGLHLEGKMVDIFEQMHSRGARVYAITDGVERTQYLESELFVGNFDPHVWFDVQLWKQANDFVAGVLASLDSTSATTYASRAEGYGAALDSVDTYIRMRSSSLAQDERVLVTSHDAFGYFGRAYGFEVFGLQGISTATEAGAADVRELATLVAARKIPSMFIESSVSPRGIEAVRAAVRAAGFEARIGGTLYGDALGSPGSAAGTYIGMIRSNIDTIVDGLKRPSEMP